MAPFNSVFLTVSGHEGHLGTG